MTQKLQIKTVKNVKKLEIKLTTPPPQKFDNYKFRPSGLPTLMTGAGKKDLGQTTKSALLEIFIKEKFGREKMITTKYMEKGLIEEDTSIKLYRQYHKETGSPIFCTKNEDKYSNDWLIGTPDLIFKDKIVDIKTSWDIWTFMKSNEKSAKSDYYYQLVGYMLLLNKKQAELSYCLVDNSEFTIYSEVKKLQYALGLNENSDQNKIDEIENQIRKNNTYSDIPVLFRVKIYYFDLLDGEKEKVETQLQLCRDYLNSLDLEYFNYK